MLLYIDNIWARREREKLTSTMLRTLLTRNAARGLAAATLGSCVSSASCDRTTFWQRKLAIDPDARYPLPSGKEVT